MCRCKTLSPTAAAVTHRCYRLPPPTLGSTCTGMCRPRRSRCLRCCMWLHRTGFPLEEQRTRYARPRTSGGRSPPCPPDTVQKAVQPSAHTRSLHRHTGGCGQMRGALTGVARLPLPAILALTEEIRHQVSTCPSVVAGVGAAVVDVCQTHSRWDLLRAGARRHRPVYKTRIRSRGFVSGPRDEPRDLLISQWSPSQPSAQMHWYTLTLSMQVPPLWHGLLSQSLMSETEDGA